MGIVEFVNKSDETFECVFKHRYSDFLVNEISENVNVIWLKIKSEQINSIEQSNTLNNEQQKIQEQLEELNNEKANTNASNQSNNNVLSPESVEDIVKRQFVGQLIIDDEDSAELKELIIKYIDR